QTWELLMEHFYENIQGWFSFADLYKEQVKNAKDGDSFVEVGAWKGRSTAYMAVEIVNSNKRIPFFVVDTWKGSEVGKHKDDPDIDRLYDVFYDNMEAVENYIQPMQMLSVDAARLFNDNTISFVFIDASHEYKDVLDDLRAWYPKVKPGG